MKYWIYSVVCLAASMLWLSSCTDTSSLEDRLDGLEDRVSALEEVVSQINANAVSCRRLMDEKIIILGLTERNDGTGYDIELNNGETLSIYRSAQGEGVTPIVGIDPNGSWIISVDGGETFTKIEGAPNAFSAVGDAPQLRVQGNGYWEISTDGGETWELLTDSDGNPFEASVSCLTDSFFESVLYDESSQTLTLVLADGQEVSLTVHGGMLMAVDGYTEGMTILYGERLEMGVTFSEDVTEAAFLSVPEGWSAQITDEGLFIVQAASSGTDGEYTVSVAVNSKDMYTRIYRFVFSLASYRHDPAACDEWNEFLAKSEDNVLLDFSFAGYDHGESAPPDVSSLGYTVYDVTDYGAVPNDGLSDRDAFIAALEAAVGAVSVGPTNVNVLQTASKNSARAIVYFPEGDFILHSSGDDTEDGQSRSIVIRAGDFVLKGAGREKTRIYMQDPNRPTDESVLYSSPDMIMLKHNSATQSLSSYVTGDAAKGAFSVTVSSTAGISAGDWICLAMKNAEPEVVAAELSPYSAASSWSIAKNGVEVNDLHQVASVSGGTITFVEPLMHAIDASWGWSLEKFNHYDNVGVEDMTFVGNAKDDFRHHGSWQDDGAYKPLSMMRLTNAWVRRVGFTSVSEAFTVTSAANVSVYDIRIDGNRGHSSIRAQASSRVFIGAVTDSADGPATDSRAWMTDAGQYHATGVAKQSMGTVLWRNRWGDDSCFESHATQPRATLIDCCRGGWMQSRQGGDSDQMPNHLADLTVWNFESTTPYSGEFIWWDFSNQWWKFLPPVIVGFHGQSVAFDQDQVIRDSSHGTAVSPESLYEAQLKERLGHVPAWLEELK